MQEVVSADHAAQQRYLVNSLIEEAVRSSQLEGANTTRRAAKDMIRSGRPPQDRSERMILNNFRALQFIRENTQAALSPTFILELHGVLTEGTLDNPESAGRLQRPDDQRVVVWNEHMNEIAHEPPPTEQLEGRLASMCLFANRTSSLSASYIRSCEQCSSTSGSPTTTRSKMVMDALHGQSSIGRCSLRDTGSQSTSLFLASCARLPLSTLGHSYTPRQTSETPPTFFYINYM